MQFSECSERVWGSPPKSSWRSQARLQRQCRHLCQLFKEKFVGLRHGREDKAFPQEKDICVLGLKLLGMLRDTPVAGCGWSITSVVRWQDTTWAGEQDPEHEEVLSYCWCFLCFVRVWTLSCRLSNCISWSTKVPQSSLHEAASVADGYKKGGRGTEEAGQVEL